MLMLLENTPVASSVAEAAMEDKHLDYYFEGIIKQYSGSSAGQSGGFLNLSGHFRSFHLESSPVIKGMIFNAFRRMSLYPE